MQQRCISVDYFAHLREHAGCAGEELRTPAETPRALYEELRARYAFPMSAAELKVAVNDEFAAWDRPLSEGDRVVFIPPVAGG